MNETLQPLSCEITAEGKLKEHDYHLIIAVKLRDKIGEVRYYWLALFLKNFG